ncbi:MAG: DISARM system phospholipase D-like protein DrmC [Bacteriovoracaceae bacterium]|nr:DISARM system phospholipase D-like protein DrmC [Bacteriovoracaceae bacterium]
MTDILQLLTSSTIQDIAESLELKRIEPPFSAISLTRVVSNEHAKEISQYLNNLIDEGFNNKTIAYSLKLLASERAKWKEINSDAIDLVWTGPEAPGTTSRDTSVVVRELFQKAKKEVIISGYAIYQGLSVFKALADTMEQNPELIVKMYLEVKRDYRDFTTEEEQILKKFIDRFQNEQWPGKRLPEVFYDPRSLSKEKGKRSALHAKCVIIDQEISFVSSANFTEAAQFRNIEAGFLVKSKWLSKKLVGQFHKLVQADVLQKINF